MLAEEMRRRPGSRRSVAVFAWAGCDERNEVLDGLDRQGWMDRKHCRRSDRDRDRVEILVGIVGYGGVHGRIHDDIGRNDQHGVAVGWRPCALTHAEIAAGATYILHVELSSELLSQLLRGETREDVRRPARRVGTITRTGRAGYVSADTIVGSTDATVAPAAICRKCRRGNSMWISWGGRSSSRERRGRCEGRTDIPPQSETSYNMKRAQFI